jgi:amino acid transporter
MLCVACAQPTVMPANAAEKKVSSIEASASSRSGNTVTTQKVSFQLCPACTAAREQQKKRQHNYPGHWWTIGVGLLATASFIGYLGVNDSGTASTLPGALFVLFVIATVAAVVLSKTLRSRNDRDNPMSESDRQRLALIEGAVYISAPSSAHPTGVALTFKNETFAQVFAAANDNAAGQWMTHL